MIAKLGRTRPFISWATSVASVEDTAHQSSEERYNSLSLSFPPLPSSSPLLPSLSPLSLFLPLSLPLSLR